MVAVGKLLPETPYDIFLTDEEICTYCYEFIYPGNSMIYWLGDTDIYLHPDCCVKLTVRLMSDYHLIEVAEEREAYRIFKEALGS